VVEHAEQEHDVERAADGLRSELARIDSKILDVRIEGFSGEVESKRVGSPSRGSVRLGSYTPDVRISRERSMLWNQLIASARRRSSEVSSGTRSP
jgi:hypothetical protein